MDCPAKYGKKCFPARLALTHYFLVLSQSGTISRLKYPFRKSGPDDESNDSGQDANAEVQFATQITYSIIPNSFIHRDSAKVMFWDMETNRWVDESVTDIEIEKETGNVKFRTSSFKPTAIVQVRASKS